MTTSFNSVILLITADRAQSIESMEEESHGPENVYTVLGEDARGNTGKQSGGEKVGLGVGGIQEVETEGKRVPE